MEKGGLSSQMVLKLRDSFRKVKFMERLKSNLLMAIVMRDSGNQTKLMDLEFIIIIRALFMKVTGLIIFKMV